MKIEDVKVGMRVRMDGASGIVDRIQDNCGITVAVVLDGGHEDHIPLNFLYEDRYYHLRTILDEALTRASEGKGKDRHANGKPFGEQPIVALNLSLGSQDGPLFQIQKKCAEASRFYASGERERAENELLDCIVYAAGAVITGRRRE